MTAPTPDDQAAAAALGKDPDLIRQVRETWTQPEAQAALAEARRHHTPERTS